MLLSALGRNLTYSTVNWLLSKGIHLSFLVILTLTSPGHVHSRSSSTVPCKSGLRIARKGGHGVRFHPGGILLLRNPKSCFRILQTQSLNKKGRMLNEYKMIDISELSSEITESCTWFPANHFQALRYLGCFLCPLARVFTPSPDPATCWCRARVVRDIKSSIHQLWGKKAWTLSISLATVSTEFKDDCQWTGHLFLSFECNCLDGSLWVLQFCRHLIHLRGHMDDSTVDTNLPPASCQQSPCTSQTGPWWLTWLDDATSTGLGGDVPWLCGVSCYSQEGFGNEKGVGLCWASPAIPVPER